MVSQKAVCKWTCDLMILYAGVCDPSHCIQYSLISWWIDQLIDRLCIICSIIWLSLQLSVLGNHYVRGNGLAIPSLIHQIITVINRQVKKQVWNIWIYYSHAVPVWVRVWRLRSNVSLKPLPQNVHKYLLMSEWHLMWRLRRRCRGNTLLQILQTNRLSSVCMPAKHKSWITC